MATLDNTVKDALTKDIDPVCGMEVKPGKTKLVALYKGKSYWFCAEGCRRAFEANPGKYMEPKPARKKGWFRRYLDRMTRINEKEFGGNGPTCCH